MDTQRFELPALDAGAFVLPDGEALAGCPAEAYLASLGTAMSRKSMRGTLNTIAALAGMPKVEQQGANPSARMNVSYRYFPWRTFRAAHVRWLDQETEKAGYAPTTRNKIRAAMVGVCRELRRMGVISAAEMEAAQGVASHRIPENPPPPTKAPVSAEEFRRMLAAGEHDLTPAHRARNDAILWLLWGCGMRRSELVAWWTMVGKQRRLQGLTLEHIDHLHSELVINLKGNSRRVPVEGEALEALQAWLDLRGRASGAVFVRIWDDGLIAADCPLASQTVRDVVHHRADKAAPPVEHMTPHRMRHNFVTRLHASGVPIGHVAKIVGHKSVETTMRYLHPERAELHQAVQVMVHLGGDDASHGGRSPGADGGGGDEPDG